MGEVQKAFNLKKQGAFRISVKNPKINTPVPGGARTGLKEKAEFPADRELCLLPTLPTSSAILKSCCCTVQASMGELRWHPLTPPSYLDHKHAELLFIATHPSDLPDITGDEILHDMEEIADEGDMEHLGKYEREQVQEEIKAEVFDMLNAREEKGVVVGGESVISGQWE
jgi:hypothetical protein